MKKFVFAFGGAVLISACQPHSPPDQPRENARAENERARQNAERDAIQAERQLKVVKERNMEAAQNPARK